MSAVTVFACPLGTRGSTASISERLRLGVELGGAADEDSAISGEGTAIGTESAGGSWSDGGTGRGAGGGGSGLLLERALVDGAGELENESGSGGRGLSAGAGAVIVTLSDWVWAVSDELFSKRGLDAPEGDRGAEKDKAAWLAGSSPSVSSASATEESGAAIAARLPEK